MKIRIGLNNQNKKRKPMHIYDITNYFIMDLASAIMLTKK